MQYKTFYNELHEAYVNFSNSLGDNLEPILIVSNVFVDNVRLLDSGLAIFSGTDDKGNPSTVIQSAQSINFAFTSRKKPVDKPRNSINIQRH